MSILHALASATFDQWSEAGGKMTLYVSHFQTWCDLHVAAGRLMLVNGVYSLSPYMTKYFDSLTPEEASDQEVVPSRTPPVWKPLSMKHIPSMNARRHDAPVFAERSHFTSGQSLEPFRGVWK